MDVAAPITREVLDELQTASLRVSSASSALRLWERILSKQDRASFDDDFAQAFAKFGTIGMWMKLRGVSAERA